MRKFNIFNKTIMQTSKPFVIAEIGNNHQGSVNLCKSLIGRAKLTGANAVKLQKRSVKNLFTKKLYNSPYLNENSFGKTYGEHREALEFNVEQWQEIINFAKKINIPLFSTAFDMESVEFLEQMGMNAYKIASGCLKDIPLIKRLIETKKPLVISTGGGIWEDIDRVYNLCKENNAEFCFLHCIASYPNRAEQMNLRVIISMRERYRETIIGLSDHYQSYIMAISAYCIGARIFEKHFTSDHTLRGSDHALSLEPHELAQLIHEFERIRAAMGNPEKQFLDCEKQGIYKMGKGIYTNSQLEREHIIKENDICIKSPAEGLPPYELKNIIGKKTKRFLEEEEPIQWEDLE